MQRRVYIKFESRDNVGLPEKVVERLAIFDDKNDPDLLAVTLEAWAAETGRTMATVLSVSKQTARKYLKDHHVPNVVAPTQRELEEQERVRGLFNGRKSSD